MRGAESDDYSLSGGYFIHMHEKEATQRGSTGNKPAIVTVGRTKNQGNRLVKRVSLRKVHLIAGSLRAFVGLFPRLDSLLTSLALLPAFSFRLLSSPHLTFRKSRVGKLIHLGSIIPSVQSS